MSDYSSLLLFAGLCTIRSMRSYSPFLCVAGALLFFSASPITDTERLDIKELDGMETVPVTHVLSTCVMNLFRHMLLSSNSCSLVSLEEISYKQDASDPLSFQATWEVCPDRRRRGRLTIEKTRDQIAVSWQMPKEESPVIRVKTRAETTLLHYDEIKAPPKDRVLGNHVLISRSFGETIPLFDELGRSTSFEMNLRELASCLTQEALRLK